MKIPDVNKANQWVEDLENGTASADLIEPDRDNGYAMASSQEYRSEYYVYYEAGLYKDIPTQVFIGSVAVADTVGLDSEEKKALLLDSARSPAQNRQEGTTLMRALMMLPNVSTRISKPRTLAEAGSRVRVNSRFGNLSDLSSLEVANTGISHFGDDRDIFLDKQERVVYMISQKELTKDCWPAVRFNTRNRIWEICFLTQVDYDSQDGFGRQPQKPDGKRTDNNYYRVLLLKNLKWQPVSEASIHEIAMQLTQKQHTSTSQDSL